MDEGRSEGGGIFASLRRLAQSAVGALQNRLELLALELQEEKCWLVTVLLWTAAVIFSAFLALTVITLTIVMLSPPAARPYVLIGFSVLYLILAVLTAVGLKRRLNNKRPPFSGSIAELKKDLGNLRSPE